MIEQVGWEAVGHAVRERRLALGFRQRQAAALANVSDTTWGNVENARASSFDEMTKAGVARALRWSVDSIDRILRGEEPIEMPDEIPDGVTYRRQSTDTVELTERLAELAGELARRAREGQL